MRWTLMLILTAAPALGQSLTPTDVAALHDLHVIGQTLALASRCRVPEAAINLVADRALGRAISFIGAEAAKGAAAAVDQGIVEGQQQKDVPPCKTVVHDFAAFSVRNGVTNDELTRAMRQ